MVLHAHLPALRNDKSKFDGYRSHIVFFCAIFMNCRSRSVRSVLSSVQYSSRLASVIAIHLLTDIQLFAIFRNAPLLASKSSTLLERLGGEGAVTAAVDVFYRRLTEDEKTAYFFEGSDLEKLKVGARSHRGVEYIF